MFLGFGLEDILAEVVALAKRPRIALVLGAGSARG